MFSRRNHNHPQRKSWFIYLAIISVIAMAMLGFGKSLYKNYLVKLWSKKKIAPANATVMRQIQPKVQVKSFHVKPATLNTSFSGTYPATFGAVEFAQIKGERNSGTVAKKTALATAEIQAKINERRQVKLREQEIIQREKAYATEDKIRVKEFLRRTAEAKLAQEQAVLDAIAAQIAQEAQAAKAAREAKAAQEAQAARDALLAIAAEEARVAREANAAIAAKEARKAQFKKEFREAVLGMDSNEARSSTSTPSHIELLPEISPEQQARITIKRHAIFLLNFSYQNQVHPNSDVNEFLHNLSFVYNFHRYNLATAWLHTEADSRRRQAIYTRTLLVHGANRILFNPILISQTAMQMQQALGAEVINLSFQRSSLWQTSCNSNVFANNAATIHTWALATELYQLNALANHQPELKENDNFNQTYLWMRECAIPFINLLHALLIAETLAANSNKRIYSDALKMMVIIVGEYCGNINYTALDSALACHERNDRVNHNQLYHFLHAFRQARNSLSHAIVELSEDKINGIVTLAQTISMSCALPTALDSVISPLNGYVTTAQFRPACASQLSH